MHRLGPGDEWVLGHLARGNGRFGAGGGEDWLPPLGTEDAAEFVKDRDTICVIAVEEGTDQLCGFAYGGVLLRRHTWLKHVCLYEIGVDRDHKVSEVGMRLLEGFAAEAREMGIRRGFVVAQASNREIVDLYRDFGAAASADVDLLFGLKF